MSTNSVRTLLGVFLCDVVTAMDEAGTVTQRSNFEWYFRGGRQQLSENAVHEGTRNVWLPKPSLGAGVASQDCFDSAPRA